MAQKFYKVGPDVPVEASVVGKNSEVFAVADPVTIASGFLKVAAAGERIIGYALDAVTMASDNQTVAKVAPKIYPALNGLVQMQYTADQAAVATDVGLFADLSGTTGAIQINLAGGASGQFVVLDYDPEKDGTTTEVIVEASELGRLAYAQV
jgi:hypothetical protein